MTVAWPSVVVADASEAITEGVVGACVWAPIGSGRVIVFHSMRAGTGRRDLWIATREATSLPWGAPVQISELNTAREDADPYLSADGLTLSYDSSRDTGSYRELFVSHRASLDDPFTPPTHLMTSFDSAMADADPWISDDGTYAVFTSSRTGEDEILEVRLSGP